MRVPLLLLGGAGAASAIVSSSSSQADSSSHSHHAATRPSLNYGTDTVRRVTSSLLDESSILHAYKEKQGYFAQGGNADGVKIAQAFLESLHPDQQFRLQSRSESNAGSVVHAYFVQTVGGRDVIDGLVNINVDLNTGSIVSYGDSAFVPTSSSACRSVKHDKPLRNQIVFGKSASAPNAEDRACPLAAAEVVDTAQAPTDPRISLVSFLLQAAPSHLSSFTSLDDIVDQITVRHSLKSEEGSHDLYLDNVPGAVSPDGVPAKLAYVQRPDGKGLALTWSFEIDLLDNWYEAHISAAHDAEDVNTALLVVDWIRDSPTYEAASSKAGPELDYAYRVFPWGTNDPSEGKRHIVTNPAYKDASPYAWHVIPQGSGRDSGKKGNGVDYPSKQSDDSWMFRSGWSSSAHLRENGAVFPDTRGNNVFAQDNPSGGSSFELNHRPKGDNGTYNFHLGWNKANKNGKDLDPKSYIDASVTELFYTCNGVHDLFHTYGFDEVSGNFQESNYGKGGLGGDAVVAMAQDGSGTNNANFATPPDGQRPRMRMYVWTTGTPKLDGDLEAGIVIHEYAHGISTRLTGGPANSGCLGWGESGGMGEGYGDFFGTMIRMQSADVVDFGMGDWASHRQGGIRKYPYSTNMTVNPETYKTLDAPGYFGVHAIGEVYAEMLFEMAETLIKKHGWTSSLFPPSNSSSTAEGDSFYTVSPSTGRKHPKHGNTYAVQLVVDSFKLQPCRPSFFDNRDAILQADQLLTGGENACTIWKAFSKRGLGPDASLRGSTPWGGGVRTNDFSIPKKCVGKH